MELSLSLVEVGQRNAFPHLTITETKLGTLPYDSAVDDQKWRAIVVQSITYVEFEVSN